MKKNLSAFLAILFALCLLLSFPIALAETETDTVNLIQNGDFEAELGSEWSSIGTITRVTGLKSNTSNVVKVTKATAWDSPKQTISLKAGVEYTISWKFQMPWSTYNWCYSIMGLEDQSGNKIAQPDWSTVVYDGSTSNDYDWQSFSYTYTPSKDVTVTIVMYTYNGDNDASINSTYYLDDIAVTYKQQSETADTSSTTSSTSSTTTTTATEPTTASSTAGSTSSTTADTSETKADNMLRNPGMEDDFYFDSDNESAWSTDLSWVAKNPGWATVTRSADRAHSGQYSLLCTDRIGFYCTPTQLLLFDVDNAEKEAKDKMLTVEPGKTYLFSGYVYVPKSEMTADSVRIKAAIYDENGAFIKNSEAEGDAAQVFVTTQGDEWVKFDLKFTYRGEKALSACFISFETTNADWSGFTGDFYLDDVFLSYEGYTNPTAPTEAPTTLTTKQNSEPAPSTGVCLPLLAMGVMGMSAALLLTCRKKAE